MKKVLFAFAIAVAFAACNDSATTEAPKTDTPAVAAPATPAADSTAKPAADSTAKPAADSTKKDSTAKK